MLWIVQNWIQTSKRYCGRAFHQKYQMFSNGNSTNFSTVPLRIIDIFTEADILNIKSWKKLNFRLSPREKMQEKNQDKSNMIFFKLWFIEPYLNYSIFEVPKGRFWFWMKVSLNVFSIIGNLRLCKSWGNRVCYIKTSTVETLSNKNHFRK